MFLFWPAAIYKVETRQNSILPSNIHTQEQSSSHMSTHKLKTWGIRSPTAVDLLAPVIYTRVGVTVEKGRAQKADTVQHSRILHVKVVMEAANRQPQGGVLGAV